MKEPMAEGTNPLVSVVTPFYNTAAFLDEAIRSVRAQRYPDFEYILADNCSTDESLEIARHHAAEDPRIRVVTHTEFIDQDANYNRALGYISPDSRYCKIVQADDTIDADCLGDMVALAEAHPTVAIVGCCFIAGDRVGGHGLSFERRVFGGREACRTRLLQGGTYFGSPTSLLYRSDVVRNRQPFFNLDETNADTTACFEILRDADFGFVPQILAYLRRGNSSTWERLQDWGAGEFMNYALVERYGPVYLSPDETRRRGAALQRAHLRWLAHAVRKWPQRGFWRFQKMRYASLGRPLPVARLGIEVIDAILDRALNPLRTVRGAVSRLRRTVSHDSRDDGP
jgi:glycosyltransferase involved in cell wall biosynthesis